MRKSFPKMNKRRRKTIAGIMAIVLLACVYPSFPVYADKVSELEQKLKEEKEKRRIRKTGSGKARTNWTVCGIPRMGLRESSVTSTIIWRK